MCRKQSRRRLGSGTACRAVSSFAAWPLFRLPLGPLCFRHFPFEFIDAGIEEFRRHSVEQKYKSAWPPMASRMISTPQKTRRLPLGLHYEPRASAVQGSRRDRGGTTAVFCPIHQQGPRGQDSHRVRLEDLVLAEDRQSGFLGQWFDLPLTTGNFSSAILFLRTMLVEQFDNFRL